MVGALLLGTGKPLDGGSGVVVVAFDSLVGVGAYRRAFVAALQCELGEYAAESWYTPTLSAAQQRYPAFAALWAEAQARLLQDGGESAGPLTLRLGRPPPSAEALTFRRERSRLYPGDPRFHTVFWRPADVRRGGRMWWGIGSGEKFDRVCKPVYNDSDAGYRAVAVRPAQASTHRDTVAAYSHSAVGASRDRCLEAIRSI